MICLPDQNIRFSAIENKISVLTTIDLLFTPHRSYSLHLRPVASFHKTRKHDRNRYNEDSEMAVAVLSVLFLGFFHALAYARAPPLPPFAGEGKSSYLAKLCSQPYRKTFVSLKFFLYILTTTYFYIFIYTFT